MPSPTYPKYVVFYCAMDTEARANPLGHASLILLTQTSEKTPVCVIDAIGFYSQPSTSTNPLIRGLKYILGFNIDLQGIHGTVKQEAMHDLDGNGLNGIPFEVSKQKFETLRSLYAEKKILEDKAIAETTDYLHSQNKPINAQTRYDLENLWAKDEKRAPRLYPFHISIALTGKGIDSTGSHACKNYALNLLIEADIIDTETRAKIIGTRTNYAFPLFTALPLSPFRLVSTGDPEKYVSPRTGAVHYNRKWNQNELFLATSLHPQKAETPNTKLEKTPNQYQLIRNILTRTQKIEVMIRKKMLKLTGAAETHQFDEQLQQVNSIYNDFSDAYTNQLSQGLLKKLSRAEKTLTIASLYLARDRMDNSFMLRAYQDIATSNALFSLACVIVAFVFLSHTLLGTALIAAPTGYLGHQLNRFFKDEKILSKMRADFNDHVQNKLPLKVDREDMAGANAEVNTHNPVPRLVNTRHWQ